MTDLDILKHILQDEGGYVDRPADKGGPTNHGITLDVFKEYRHDIGADVPTVDDLKNLDEATASTILYQRYLIKPGFSKIASPEIRAFVVDMAVNHGVSGAIKLIQKEYHLDTDGIFGPATLAAINAVSPSGMELTIRRLVAARIRYYGRIITHDPSQAVFAAGWLDRVADFLWDNG